MVLLSKCGCQTRNISSWAHLQAILTQPAETKETLRDVCDPIRCWTRGGRTARGSPELAGRRLAPVEERWGALGTRHRRRWPAGSRHAAPLGFGDRQQPALHYRRGEERKKKKAPPHCEPICIFRHFNTLFNTFILNGLNTCLEQQECRLAGEIRDFRLVIRSQAVPGAQQSRTFPCPGRL